MLKQPLNLLRYARTAAGGVAALGLIVGFILIAQGFIDTRDYRAHIVEAIKEQTGREIAIKGSVHVSLLPLPTIYVPGVELRGHGEEEAIPAITIEMLRIRTSLFSLFSDTPLVTSITLQKPTLEIERSKDGAIDWDWLNADLLHALTGKAYNDRPITLSINDGKIFYHNNRDDTEFSLHHIQLEGNGGATPSLQGTMENEGRRLEFSLLAGTRENEAEKRSIKLSLVSNENDALTLDGMVDMSGELPELTGSFSLQLTDALVWLFAEDFAKGGTAQREKFPFSLKGNWQQKGWNINISDAEWEGLASKAVGTLSLAWNKLPTWAISMDFSSLNLTNARRAFDYIHQAKREAGRFTGKTQTIDQLPRNIEIAVNLTSQHIDTGGEQWKNGVLNAKLVDGEITINQLNIDLPGDSTLALFGIISRAATKELRFDGGMETRGNSLRQLLTIFDASAADLPETGLGAFSLRSNIFLSSELLRLSEANAKISDLALGGGLVAYFDSAPRVEAEVQLKDINFDYFRDIWRGKQKEAGKQDFFLQLDKSIRLDWLKKMALAIDFSVAVDQFTFLEKKGDKAKFRLFINKDEFGFSNARFFYPDDDIGLDIRINTKEEQPAFHVVLSAREFDTNYLSLGGNSKPWIPAVISQDKTEGNRWSSELIDMSWLQGMRGEIDLSVGKLIYGNYAFEKLKMNAVLNDNQIAFKTLSTTCWQGRCDLTGKLIGGKVPVLSIGYTLSNIELQDVLRDISGRENVTGRVNANGTLSTSGINFLSWISQLKAEIKFQGTGIHVNNLNVQGVIDAVSVAQTAADVTNTVNRALLDGSTDFVRIGGDLNIKDGVLRTPGIGLGTTNADGSLTGEVRLVPWQMELSSTFQFPSITRDTTPTMTIQLAGDIGHEKLQTDTSSLEAHVSKRITGH